MAGSMQPDMARDARRARIRFVAVAILLCITMAGATLASPLYPIYRIEFGLRPSGITIAYASYMVGALLALLVARHVTEHLGFVRTMALAGAILVGGLLASALARNLAALALGRWMIGNAAGIASTAGTAGLIVLEPAGDGRRGTLTGSVATIAGLGLGPLIGGLLAQFTAAPLSVPYVVAGAFALVCIAFLLMLPADKSKSTSLALRGLYPRWRVPPRHLWSAFALIASATFLGYALFSIFASLAPSLIVQMLPWKGPVVSGASVALLFAGSTVAQLLFRELHPRHGLALGSAIVATSLAVLAFALMLGSAGLFIISDLIGGFGQGLGFMAALATLNRLAPDDQRTGLIAAFFAASYLGGVLPVLGLGLLADRIGLHPAVICLAVVMGAAALALAAIIHRAKGPIADR